MGDTINSSTGDLFERARDRVESRGEEEHPAQETPCHLPLEMEALEFS